MDLTAALEAVASGYIHLHPCKSFSSAMASVHFFGSRLLESLHGERFFFLTCSCIV